jgi:tRNA (cytidine/uridine-2'-O-)-methyltransferase
MNKPKIDTSWKFRLRMTPPESTRVNVVLVNPEIPQNTGNIARLCAATGTKLHLVGKLGFSLDEKAVRRAGLDYWNKVEVKTYSTFSDFLMKRDDNTEPLLFTTSAHKSFVDAPYKPGSVLVFGSESVGLPKEILSEYKNSSYGIPTLSQTVRSLNLANSVAIAVYKSLEVIGALKNIKCMP